MATVSRLTTCTACGATCDDICLHLDEKGKHEQAERACDIGEAWFGEPVATGPDATIDGKPAKLEAAVDRAVDILRSSRHPLVTGLRQATTEAIRAATELADRLGACIDWTVSPADAAGTLALQSVGCVTATLGEVAQRADMVLLWSSDPATTHPRHFERYLLEPTSPWLPAGRGDRTLVVVDDGQTESAAVADESIVLGKGAEYEAIAVLRAIIAGLSLDAEQVKLQTGVALARWKQLAAQLQAAKYGAVVYGKRLVAGGPEPLAELTRLMADLTATTRWVCLAEGGAGNSAGAANVLAWQTGYPLGVNLAEGYPQYGPDEWTTAAVLERGEVDAALTVADDLATQLGPAASSHLRAISAIACDWRDTATMQAAEVAIYVARPGVECGGTTYRVDGLAVPLRPARSTNRPTAEAVLRKITKRIGSTG